MRATIPISNFHVLTSSRAPADGTDLDEKGNSNPKAVLPERQSASCKHKKPPRTLPASMLGPPVGWRARSAALRARQRKWQSTPAQYFKFQVCFRPHHASCLQFARLADRRYSSWSVLVMLSLEVRNTNMQDVLGCRAYGSNNLCSHAGKGNLHRRPL